MSASKSRLLPVLTQYCLVFMLAAQIHAEEGTQLADPAETMKAVTIGQQLFDEALEFDRAGGRYPVEYFQKLLSFYKYGIGTRQEPGDSVVTRKFCRYFVIGILSDLFSAGENEPDESQEDNQTLKNPMNGQSVERAGATVTFILISARDDLTPWQREFLYGLAAKRLTNDNSAALLALRMLAASTAPSSSEQALLSHTVETIENRSPS